MYVAAAVVCFAQIAGLDALTPAPARIRAIAFASCLGSGVYLLDRVKLRDAWLDPADAAAHPGRFRFLAARTRPIRALIAMLLALAALAGARLAPWGAALPALACAGVLLYAARPRAVRPRPKDILGVKNLYVAVGITGFAFVTALAAASPANSPAEARALISAHGVALAISGAHLLTRIFADAALCDLDDESADRIHGTRTLPGLLGRDRAWAVAMLIRLSLASLLALPALVGRIFPGAHAIAGAIPPRRALAWAAVTIASTVAMRLARPRRLRDLVDARFALEAALVTLAGTVWPDAPR